VEWVHKKAAERACMEVVLVYQKVVLGQPDVMGQVSRASLEHKTRAIIERKMWETQKKAPNKTEAL